jgi:hypothetical protein
MSKREMTFHKKSLDLKRKRVERIINQMKIKLNNVCPVKTIRRSKKFIHCIVTVPVN